MDYYRKLEMDARKKYLHAQKEYADFCDTHKGTILQTYISEQESLENELQLVYTAYSQMKAMSLTLTLRDVVLLSLRLLAAFTSCLPVFVGRRVFTIVRTFGMKFFRYEPFLGTLFRLTLLSQIARAQNEV